LYDVNVGSEGEESAVLQRKVRLRVCGWEEDEYGGACNVIERPFDAVCEKYISRYKMYCRREGERTYKIRSNIEDLMTTIVLLV
jgi:hypothetical protein